MDEDKELAELLQNPSTREQGFRKLVERFQKKLYWQIRRMVLDHDDCHDVLQNVFIKAWKGLDNFRFEAKLSTWLFRIAANESITFLEKKRSALFISVEEYDLQLSSKLEDDNFFSGDAIEKKLQKAILTLPDKQRAVFNLRYYDEMKYEEMSEVLHTSVGALKASYHHAAKKIEEFLKND